MTKIMIDRLDDIHHEWRQPPNSVGAKTSRRRSLKVTREKAAEHRAAIVEAAGRLFRARGFDGVGVAEITRAAGLTHGGFYGHFASKDALAAEACGQAFAESLALLRTRLDKPGGDLLRYVDSYLSERHRDRRDGGCPMAAYGTEVPHQDGAVQDQFAAGVGRFVDAIAERLSAAEGVASERRRRAITVAAALVGGLTLARATAHSSPEISAEILASLRTQLAELVGPERQSPLATS
jgi:TetR/AcrR family transcriptional regulator, transcriptional repressor for nem operon